VLVLVLAGGGAALYLAHRLDTNVARIPHVFDAIPQAQRPHKVVADAENILLIGSDSRAGVQTTGRAGNASARSPIGQRSDTIMLVHLAANRRAACVVSIPRDSWVPIPGHGSAKINAAYAYGGPALLIRTVEQLTGVRVDHFAAVDFAGFRAMTDAVGGVDVRLARGFTARGYRFHAGVNHIDGGRALAFVRERYALPRGDFDRIDDQHKYLRAMAAKAMSKRMLTQPVALAHLLDAVTRSISVDSSMSSGQLRSLALSLRGLRGGDLHFLTVPVKGTGWEGAQSVVFLDPAKDRVLYRELRDDRFGR
jgi:LCP family protein required for cell wall assembly